jgi:hypothetical protein
MYEDAVASAVQAAMEAALSSANASRPFMVQTLLPSALPPHHAPAAREAAAADRSTSSAATGAMKNAPGYPKDTVRADHTLQQGQLEAFLTRGGGGVAQSAGSKRSKGDGAQAGGGHCEGEHHAGGWTRGQASTTAG